MPFSPANDIAQMVSEEELNEDYIIPRVLNRKVPEQVAQAVKESAIKTGGVRKG